MRRLKLPVVQSLLTSAPTVAKGPQHSAFKDLETICLKCLAKNPAARYPSAAALADDLDRWLGGEPIQARSATLVEVGVRWARRHRVGAALLGVAALLPALIIAGLLWANAYSAREREQTRLNLYAADMALAATAIEQGNFGQAGQLLAGHEPRPGQRDLRGFEWHWLRQQARGDAQAQFQPFTNAVLQLAVSPDGRWLAAGANGHQHTWVLDAVEDRVAARPESRLPPGDAMSLAFSADGQWLAGGGRGVTLWQVPAFRFSAQTNLHTYWAYFLPGAENLLLVSHRDPIEGRQWWDKANRLTLFNSALERVKDFGEATNYYGSLSRDGGTLVAYDYNRATVWDTTNATVLKQFTTTIGFHRIALSPDGRRAAILYQMRPTVELWDPRAGERLGEFVGSKANPHCVDFSPDGRLLATGAGDELIRLWDVDTRQEVRRLRGHHLGVASVAFFPDGNRLASGGDDGGVRLWDLTPPTARENPATNLAPPLVFSADGRQLAAGLRTGGLGIWETDSRRLLRAWPDVELASLAARPGAEGFLLLGREGTGQTNLRVFSCSAASDALQPAGPLAFAPGAATLLALSPDGATCLSGHTNGQVRWWDVASGRLTADVPGHSHPLWRAGFSADGRRAVTTTQFPNTFRAWSAAPPRALGTNYFPGRSGLQCLVLSPDGRQCVTGGRRLGFHIWNTDDFTPLATFPAQRAEVHQLAWSPDGQTLATASLDGKLRLWHLPTRRPLLTLQDRPTTEPRLVALAFSPDGQWLAACDAGGELHLWPAPRQELRRAAK